MRPAFTGVEIPPRWSIVPAGRAPGEDPAGARAQPDPGGEETALAEAPRGRVRIALRPGAGFGLGDHETTQLCLQALAALAPRDGLPWRALDFGSGSGILSIAAAKLGAQVVAVEIDARAVADADENLRLNAVADRVSQVRALDGAPGPFALVLANILRPVLVAHAEELVARLAPGGAIVLSGLVATDVPEVSARFAPHLDGARPAIHRRGEWMAMVWRTAERPPVRGDGGRGG